MPEKTIVTQFFHLGLNESLEQLNTQKSGLSQEEAEKRIEQYGLNQIVESKKRSLLQKFADQFKDAMIIILILAAIFSVVLEGSAGKWDAIIILAVVLINAIMGVVQENKAEEAIDSLQEMSSPQAIVIRSGQIQEINAKELVPGDIVSLEAGAIVPADMRLIESNSLQIEEAALTGESVPVDKQINPVPLDASLGDRTNMAFASTNVTYGRGLGVVTATAMETEVGHIASMLETAETKKTPLQVDQDKLTKFLTIVIITIAVVIFLLGLWKARNWVEMLLTAISVAVAALPEGLPAISTIILALGTQKMADRNALVRKLPAVETLGGTEVICSDKTGTLTQNKMTVEKVYYNGIIHEASEEIDFNEPVFKIMNLTNDTTITATGELTGDPTETALIKFGQDKGFDIQSVLQKQARIGEIPFDSDRKLSSTIHPTTQSENSPYIIMVKGAPDVLLDRCVKYYHQGEIRDLDQQAKDNILQANQTMAENALRVLAMAYAYLDKEASIYTSEEHEQNLIFAGLVGEIDPERPEAKEAIAKAKAAGIRTIMITGDHQITAAAIAKRLGILSEKDSEKHVTTGAYLDQISDEQLVEEIEQYAVYARVAPEHKVRIVKAWQDKKHNKIVAMTGDGVNDAPSLKQADIGVGMGITGTEVSKGASDMVLADDNFATIVTAIEEGRKVFANIQKAVQYLLSANLGEVMALFVATFMGWTILEPIHILWINLVTDTFPALALGVEAAEKDVMKHAPRGRKTHLLSGGVLTSIIYQGIYEGGITLFVYWYATNIMRVEHVDAEAMAFLTLCFLQLIHAYNCRSVFRSLFDGNPFANKSLNLGNLVSCILLFITIFLPGLNNIFGTVHLVGDPVAPKMWLVILLASFSVLVYVEVAKWIMRVTGYRDRLLDGKN